MTSRPKRTSLFEEIEAVFTDCREQIRKALRQYELEIHSALQDLHEELSGSKSTVH